MWTIKVRVKSYKKNIKGKKEYIYTIFFKETSNTIFFEMTQ